VGHIPSPKIRQQRRAVGGRSKNAPDPHPPAPVDKLRNLHVAAVAEAVMAVETLWCLVGQRVVERVLDDDGLVTSVICPEYDRRVSTCHLKGGVLNDRALSQLVEHVPDHPLDHPAGRCVLR
jgi:hypothetical protein